MDDEALVVTFLKEHTSLPFDECFEFSFWSCINDNGERENRVSLGGFAGPFYSMKAIREVVESK